MRLKVDELIQKSGEKQATIAEETGLRASTISKYKNSYVIRYDVEVLNTLINYFDITDMNDLIEIIEE
ncbi:MULTISPECIES: helix-turn-helix transcriptional regulator [unclassified Carnobacterium]|uniref:helix-turn-helix domain-containing protein n=1 Tax=unclassified Carnobacterium TaxID=257487 RepID=UPI0011EF697F|nr:MULTISPECIES: helix-turn-helix transcriptional regulator [unclassified Carnobacterium]